MRVLTTSTSQGVSACILNIHRHFLHRPLELTGCFVRVLLISASQYVSAGGGLYIYGTATLIDTNVYANRAEFGQSNVVVPLIAS